MSWFGNFWPSGRQKHSDKGVSRAASQRKVFWTFCTCFEISFLKLGIYIYLLGSVTHRVRVSSQSGHPDLLYSQNGPKPQNYIEPSDLVHTLTWQVTWTILLFVMAIFGLLVATNITFVKVNSAELPATGKFSEFFFYMLLDITLKPGIYIR